MNRRGFAALALLLSLLLLAGIPSLAQEEELQLRLRRDFGYGGFGEIQGLFTMTATGPEDLVRVEFLVDGVPIGAATQAPFKLQFHTDNFPPGLHTLSAVGYTAGGRELRSNETRPEFLSKEAAGKGMTKVLLPVIGLVVLLVVGMALATLITARRKGPVPLGQPRKYGFSGGTICRRCARPFALSPLGLNLVTGKLVVCPHCGKWQVARSLPLDVLRAAEAAEAAAGDGGSAVAGAGDDERLRKALDDSRYQE